MFQLVLFSCLFQSSFLAWFKFVLVPTSYITYYSCLFYLSILCCWLRTLVVVHAIGLVTCKCRMTIGGTFQLLQEGRRRERQRSRVVEGRVVLANFERRLMVAEKEWRKVWTMGHVKRGWERKGIREGVCLFGREASICNLFQ